MLQNTYLHQFTFPELITTKLALINMQGECFTGPDRKQVKAKDLWLAWQRDVAFAAKRPGSITSEVMDYFQDTKHLSRPPAEGDVGLRTESPLEVLEIEDPENPQPLAFGDEKPLFGVSYTGMTTFITCPLKWAAEKDFKEVPYVESEEQKWGNRVHLAMENTLRGKATRDDVLLLDDKGWMKYPKAILAAPGEKMIEKELCLTKGLRTCGWKDFDVCWFRLKGDVLIRQDRALKYIDWKTGKKKEDPFQILVTWAIASVHFPDIDTFDGKLLFLKEEKDPIYALPRPLTRDDLPKIWAKIFSITQRMEEAWKTKNYRMQSSGLCRKYCGYTKCPHCGK